MFKQLMNKITNGENLSENEMVSCMENIMSGNVDDILIAGFLTSLKTKGESIDEITGAAKVLRNRAELLELENEYTIDTCGTGGDGTGSYNISTAASIIIASGGVKVTKHGNRSISSQCGSADVLEALGLKIELSKEQAKQCLEETNICFLYAPKYHNAMKYVANVRKTLGVRTMFNILGPLANPALANGQVLGVFHPDLTELMAKVLLNLGVKKALVVHGYDGLDELTVTTTSKVTELNNGHIRTYTVTPEEFGLNKANPKALLGGNALDNAKIIRNLLEGEKGPKRDILVLNAGAALYVADKVDSIKEGVNLAVKLIDSGAALEKLNQWISVSNRLYFKNDEGKNNHP